MQRQLPDGPHPSLLVLTHFEYDNIEYHFSAPYSMLSCSHTSWVI